MALHQPARLVTDLGILQGCNVVFFNANGEHPNCFALSCRIGSQPHVAILDPRAWPSIPLPFIQEFNGECVSFGPDFLLDFDRASIAFDVAANVGDLVIAADRLHARCHSRRGSCFLDLESGDVVATPNRIAVVRKWSISLSPHSALKPLGPPLTIVERPEPATAGAARADFQSRVP